MFENCFIGGWWAASGSSFWIEVSEPEQHDVDESVSFDVIFKLGHEELRREFVYPDEAMTALDSFIYELENEHSSVIHHIELVGYNTWEGQVESVLSEFEEVYDHVCI